MGKVVGEFVPSETVIECSADSGCCVESECCEDVI